MVFWFDFYDAEGSRFDRDSWAACEGDVRAALPADFGLLMPRLRRPDVDAGRRLAATLRSIGAFV